MEYTLIRWQEMQKKETSNISTEIGLAYNCQVNIFSARNECVRVCEWGERVSAVQLIRIDLRCSGEWRRTFAWEPVLSLSVSQFNLRLTNEWLRHLVSVIILLKDGNVCLMNGPKRIGVCLWKWLLLLAPDNKRRVATCSKCSNATKPTRPHRFYMDKEKTEH